jgi:hypothetical protein
MTQIHLLNSSMQALVRGGIEAHHYEAFAYLYGRAEGEIVKIDHAQFSQTARRKPTKIYLSGKFERRMDWVPKDLEHVVGDFHTHAPWWNNESRHQPILAVGEGDEAAMREGDYPEHVALIMTIKQVRACRKPHITDTRISGTVIVDNTKYNIALAGYYLDNGVRDGRIRRAELQVQKETLDAIFAQ